MKLLKTYNQSNKDPTLLYSNNRPINSFFDNSDMIIQKTMNKWLKLLYAIIRTIKIFTQYTFNIESSITEYSQEINYSK